MFSQGRGVTSLVCTEVYAAVFPFKSDRTGAHSTLWRHRYALAVHTRTRLANILRHVTPKSPQKIAQKPSTHSRLLSRDARFCELTLFQ